MQNRVDILSRIYILRGITNSYTLGYRAELVGQIKSHLSELIGSYPWLPAHIKEVAISYNRWPSATLKLGPRFSIRYLPETERLRYPDIPNYRYLVTTDRRPVSMTNDFQEITNYLQRRGFAIR